VGVLRPSAEGLQVVLGPIADAVAMEMRAAAGPLAALEEPRTEIPHALHSVDPAPWLKALGGRGNVIEAGAAASRVWLRLKDAAGIDDAALRKLGVRMIARPEPGSTHLLVPDADSIAAALQPA
jgi:PTS system N-acetylglucosamine-specific IIC component